MTLQEAIQHCREKAEQLRCTNAACAADHQFLLSCLLELERYRAQSQPRRHALSKDDLLPLSQVLQALRGGVRLMQPGLTLMRSAVCNLTPSDVEAIARLERIFTEAADDTALTGGQGKLLSLRLQADILPEEEKDFHLD